MADTERTKEVEWAKLSWRKVQEVQRTRNPVVLIPLGCVETQGPYTPVGMEFLLADRLAREVAARTGALALPAVPYGNSDNFYRIPGTIFIRPEVLMGLYEDILRSVYRARFDHALFIAYHIPNQWVLERAARKVREDTGLLCAWVNPGALAARYLPELFADPKRARGHGAEPGISLAQYLWPDTTDMTGAEAGAVLPEFRGYELQGGVTMHQGFPVEMPINWEELYPATGGYGDPTLGGPEQGKAMFERLVAHLVGVVQKFAAMDTRAPVP
jgi:creatinine amidohydrolase